MLLFAMDNDPPATVVLISGDRDFSHVIGVLRLRQYDVVLMTPPNPHPSLSAHATLCLDWNKDVFHRGYVDVSVSAGPVVTPPTVSATSSSSHRPSASSGSGGADEVSLETYLIRQSQPSQGTATSHFQPPAPSARSEWSRVSSAASISSFTTCNSSPGQSSDSEQWTDIENDNPVEQTTFASAILSPQSSSPDIATHHETTKSASASLPLPVHTPSSTIPSDIKSDVRPALTESQIAGPLPHQFVPLIKVLQVHRERGQLAPFRPAVAVEVLTANRSVLDILPDDSPRPFASYAELAKAYGVVDLGGSGGDAWISLLPRYHNFEA
jgi:NYN domain